MPEQPVRSHTRGVQSDDLYRWHAFGFLALVGLTLPLTVAFMILSAPEPESQHTQWAQAASDLGVEPIHLAVGETFFRRTCAVCHGLDGQGIPKLGKPLRNSEYVQSHSDEDLRLVIAQGRAPTDPENTTGAPMPPRANNPMLDDERLGYVVAYLRTMQDPGAPTASLEDWIVETTPEGSAPSAGLVGASQGVGHDTFVASCSACHGANAQGLEGLGKPLSGTPFITDQSDEDLLRFIKSGRPIWDASNTTGLDMPPKGGNPALSDEEILNIIKYLRTLHEQQTSG
ncbi:MAG: c-type cytochrome [Phycisphaerales bacterium JB043]